MKAVSLAALCVFAALAAPGSARAGEPAETQATAPRAREGVTASEATHAFEGIWMFDAKRSDDPRKVMESARGGEGRGPGGGTRREGGGMGRGGMGHGGMRRGGMEGGGPPGEGPEGGEPAGESPNGRGGGDPRRAMERVFNPAKKMVVYVDHDRFQVEEDEGSPRVYTMADSLKAMGVNALEDEGTVRLLGRRLEAKQPLGRRGALLETYELSDDGRTLTIRARRQGGPEGMPNPTFTRVYAKYEGE